MDLTNTQSKNPFKLCPCAANLKYTDLLPFNEKNGNTVTKVFLRKMVEMFLDHIRKMNDRNEKVLEFRLPGDMESCMDYTIPQKPLPLQQILNDCHQTLFYHVKNGHPRFLSQQTTGFDLISLAAEWLTSVCNSNMHTYEVASAFVIIENAVFEHMRQVIGYEKGESFMAPGGSVANLYAVLAALYKKNPEIKTKGLAGIQQQYAVFTSKTAHFSIKKACVIAGIGLENCIEVECGLDDRIDVQDLSNKIEEAKAEEKIPLFVNCTLGTNAFGAFDDLTAVKELARKHDAWLHVDAQTGGSLMLSRKYRKCLHYFDGIEDADSITWCPTRMMNTHISCATIHFKEEGVLEDLLAMKAKYLFMEDKPYDVRYDIGDKMIQAGRRNDIFKLWLLWRARGNEGFEKCIDRYMELTKYMTRRIQDQCEKFHLIREPTFNVVNFYYIPKRLREQAHSKEKEAELGKVTMQLKTKMMACGTLMLAAMKDDNYACYFRAIIGSNAVTEKDIDFTLCELDRLGSEM